MRSSAPYPSFSFDFRFPQDRRPGFRAEPLTLQPGLKFYSPPVEEIPDVPDPESRRHRAAKAKVGQDSKTLPNELQKTQDNCEMM
ncbi:Uncharacterized protein SCF082_LOCUS48805 [Durusdinium trenchii]|uniref:Uncharacterized protein n=1 Tax=Durusdinium trenchii TaxID=1381693 RepID=A0ABP0RVF6_9DINO